MEIKTLIVPTATTATSPLFASNHNLVRETAVINSNSGVTIAVDSAGGQLAGTETITVEYTTDRGATYAPLVIDGVTQQLNVNNNALTIFGPLDYRLNKSTTVAAVGAVAIY